MGAVNSLRVRVMCTTLVMHWSRYICTVIISSSNSEYLSSLELDQIRCGVPRLVSCSGNYRPASKKSFQSNSVSTPPLPSYLVERALILHILILISFILLASFQLHASSILDKLTANRYLYPARRNILRQSTIILYLRQIPLLPIAI